MPRKTKFCHNFRDGKHLNDGNSPSYMHCSKCYESEKARLAKLMETVEQQGGPVEGLRAARMLAGGSFGYENNAREKETNLRAFFHYVMPHVPEEKAESIIKEAAATSTVGMVAEGGRLVTVKRY